MNARVILLIACCLTLQKSLAMAQTGVQTTVPIETHIALQAQTKALPMGRTVALRVTVKRADHPPGGQEVWTYLEGRRWGAVGHTDSEGHVILRVPLPNPGLAHLTVALPPASPPTPAHPFSIGLPLTSTQSHSNVVTVRVLPQKPTLPLDPAHRVGMAWEPWFTPLNARWDTAEAVSLLGNYPSENADVDRQQMLWMDAMGVDFLLIDWSNNIWGASHWSEHPPGVDQLVAATTRLMDTLAQMRTEGLPTPQVTLLLGLINGPPAKMTALNEELQYVYDSYIAPPRYKDLWVDYRGKPLITVLDTQGPDYLKQQPPIDESRFTIRWMSTQMQQNRHAQAGFWSWMDGVVHPIPTYAEGKAEALTVTPAFFGEGGWTYPAALGRRGGATYLEEFRTALELHPAFLLLNQWNEFAGQAKGDGYGPKKDQYVDTYNVPLSDDIEPTSLTGRGLSRRYRMGLHLPEPHPRPAADLPGRR